MASGMVSSLLSAASRLLDLLRSPAAASSFPPCGETADLQRLERLLRRVQATLDDAGERELRDSSVRLWIEELNDLARDAEDVLDDCRYVLLWRRAQELHGAGASTSRKRKHDDNEDCGISQRIGNITRQFEEISRDRAALQLRPEDGERTQGRDTQWESTETSHLLDESLVFGRSKEKACIIKSLLCCNQGTGIHVLPIVGMGGIGKTTIAQIVYNDGQVQERFDLAGWVHVSEKFDLGRLTVEISNSLTRRPCGFNALSSVHVVLKEGVNGKSVFLVLDDLWNERHICWQDLLRPLKFAQNVTILVTTRSKEVARLVQTVESLVLDSLPEDDCWLLFQRYAFGDIIDEESNLVKLGRRIMHKCGGLPLAVKSIGCLLRSNMDMQTWMEISESEFWEYSDGNEEIFSALRLSFYRMPARLKPCFLLCTLCPKGKCFTKNDMIHMWIAHGYIQPARCKTLEEVASEYFDDLNGRSLIETDLNLSNCSEYLKNQLAKSSVESSDHLFSRAENFDELHIRSLVDTFRRRTTKGSSGQSLSSLQLFRLHDMTWDLAKSLSSRSVTAFPGDGCFDVANKDQHLFLQSCSSSFMVNSHCDHLRTLVLKCHTSFNIAINNFTYLRALVLDSCVVFGCISGIQNLKHLRYLHVNNSYLHGCSPGIGKEQELKPYQNLELLPQTIRHLYNLEKLIISTCWQDFSMQSCNLISLRYLHLSIQFNDWPLQFCQLYNLETLCLQNCYIITQFLSCIGNLMNLRHLQLSQISKIKMLNRDSFLCQNNKCQLSQVMFPALEKLEIDGLCDLLEWCGFQDSDCPKLYSITIRNCRKLKRIHYFGSVRKLIISNLALTDLQLSVYSAPSQLHTLDIRDCQNLNSLMGLRNLYSLGSLCIAHCPELTVSRKESLPYKPQHVFIDDCPGLMEWCFEQKLHYQIPKIVEVSFIKRALQHGSADFRSFEHLCLDICPEKRPELILSPDNWLSSELRLLKFGLKRSLGSPSIQGDFSMLRRLEIRGCPKLAAVMDLEELNALHSLVISGCPLLYMLPETKFPPLLSSLTVQGCHRLLSLHLNLTDPSQLIELEVSDCQGLVYIGRLECLSNLESLLVLHCPLLELQEWLPVIPESVTVFLCPKLKKWCRVQSIEYQENLPDPSY